MSTIGDPFSTTVQALGAIQRQVSTISQNVAHAYDPNYNRRDVTVGDPGNGVSIAASVTRVDDTGLRSQILDATAQVSGADTRNNLFQAQAQSNGAAQSTSITQDRIDTLTQAAQAFQADPNTPATQSALISAGDAFANSVRQQFTALRTAQANTQADATQSISDLNAKLQSLANLNTQAQSEFANGGISPNTADQQNTALKDIAKLVPISVTDNGDGSINVQTKGGTPLVGKVAAQFSFDSASGNIIAAGSTPPAVYGAPGSLNTSFDGAKLGALVDSLDPNTSSPNPANGFFAKNRAQLSALVDTFANTSTFTNPQPNALVNSYASSPASLPTDLPGGVAQGQGLFVTNSVPGKNDEESFAINPALANGTATIKQGFAAGLVSFLTTPNQAIGAAGASVGGLTLTNQTPGQLAGGITSFWSAAQASATGQSQQVNQTQQGLGNLYAARNGVNVDQEMVSLSAAQNLYKANARILETQSKLFSTLLDMVK